MKNPLIIALDIDTIEEAREIVEQTHELVWGYKIGNQLFYRYMFSDKLLKLCEEIENVFLDLKFHDIPNTIGNTIAGIKQLNPKIFTVHAAGGKDMIKEVIAARRRVWPKLGTGPRLAVVTILTSMSSEAWRKMYPNSTMEDCFLALLTEAVSAGAEMIVCSGWEVNFVKTKYPTLATIVTGVRLLKSADDQVRIVTPKDALDRGADFIVVGRPIVATKKYLASTLTILDSINGARQLMRK